MVLSDQQKQVLYQIVNGVKNEQLQTTLGGLAGTGKSTLIKYLVKFFTDFNVCAYTGKAANVLRKKGISASTIHSLIYRPIIEDGKLTGFDLVPKVELECDGFIVDEGSMVTKDIYEDLKSYGLPCVFVGDHGQLEPIGTSFNLMAKPDYVLEEIHRNAGDIPRFAGRLRQGYKSHTFKGEDGTVRLLSQRSLTDDDLLGVDQVIVAYNRTRVELNKRMRAAQGYKGLLNVGEKIICLRNNKLLHLYNGMQGVVKNLYKDGKRLMMDFEFDGLLYCGIWYDARFFNCEKPAFDYIGYDNPNPFDYAGAITCHKSQGDEFESVLVLEQPCKKWDMRRWNYTAASRAEDRLGWANE